MINPFLIILWVFNIIAIIAIIVYVIIRLIESPWVVIVLTTMFFLLLFWSLGVFRYLKTKFYMLIGKKPKNVY